MAKQFRVNTLILSGKEISVDKSDPNSFLAHDGSFKSATVGYGTSGDIESTGTSLQNQISSLPSYNLEGFTTSGELENTGAALQNQINDLDIPSVAGLTTSGDVEATGTYIVNNYYLASNPNNYTSNNLNGLTTSGELENTGTALQDQINALDIPSVVGLSTSGDLDATGTALQNQIDTLPSYNLEGFTTSGELESTGTSLQNQLGNYYLNSNPNSFSTSGNVENTGTNVLSYVEATYETIANVAATGDSAISYITGNLVSLTGAGNITIITGVEFLYVSGDVGGFVTSGELEATGTNALSYVAANYETVGSAEATGTAILTGPLNIASSISVGSSSGITMKKIIGPSSFGGVWVTDATTEFNYILRGSDTPTSSTYLHNPNSAGTVILRKTNHDVVTVDLGLVSIDGNITASGGRVLPVLDSGSLDEKIAATGFQLKPGGTVGGLAIQYHANDGRFGGSSNFSFIPSTNQVLHYGTYEGCYGAKINNITGVNTITGQTIYANGGRVLTVLDSGSLDEKIEATGTYLVTQFGNYSTNENVESTGTDVLSYVFSTYETIANVESTGTQLLNQIEGNLFSITGAGGIIVTTGNSYLYISGENLSTSGNVENTGTALQNQINNISPTIPINHNFFFDYPFSGLNMAESYIQEDFIITGIVLGVNVTGFSNNHLGCEFYQRLTDGITKIYLASEFLPTGTYHKLSTQSNLLVTGMNRLTIDITGLLSGFEGFSIGILGYK